MPTFNVPGSIDATGATNVTAALQSWINGVPNGTAGSPNILRFPGGSKYRIDATVRLENRSWLTFDTSSGVAEFTGEGVVYNEALTNQGAARTRAQWFLEDCTGITFRRIRTEGSNRSYHFSHTALRDLRHDLPAARDDLQPALGGR